MKTEAKVGLFITLSLVFLFGLLSQLSSFDNMFKKSYPIMAKIDDGSGLKSKAKVKLKGVNIGYVESILLENNNVITHLLIDDGVEIPDDSIIIVSQDSLLGGKFLDIRPGSSTDSLKANMLLEKQEKQSSIADASTAADEAFQEIKLLVNEIRDMLNSGAKDDIEESLANINEFTKLLASISTEDNETIHEILENANETIKGFKTVGGDITKTTEKFNKTADEFTSVAQNFNRDLPAIMAKIDSITSYLDSIGATLDAKLPTAIDKFVKLEDNLNDTIEKKDSSLNKALTSVDGFFTEGTETMEKIDKYLDSMIKSELHVELRADEVYDDGGYAKTHFNLALKPDATRYYMIGLTSAPSFEKDDEFSRGFAGNKKHESGEYLFSAQYGKRFDDLLFRIGIIEGAGGFGVDYFGWNDTLKISANLYDFNAVNDIRGNNPNLSTTVRYQFFRHINAYLSANNLFNSQANSVSAGFGVSFVDNDLKNLLGSAASAAQ
ncbi:MCE family protein [Sulfurovum sp. bin170]|uniref:MlaD family protein n=1 Tax=Sulfurovum sp. bin170 TaxID=2695268 RepID=UPI0013DFB6B5|nr:MlaD family protein [Sulfurovum sp. bin170]NEW60303.1 MCE family protein [Sulfurovum sp. bin170]